MAATRELKDALEVASTTDAGVMSAADKTKLNGITSGATANSSDATLLARANHTGTQLASTISDFSEAVDDRVGALIIDSVDLDFTYDDAGNADSAILKTSGVTAATYGDATHVSQVTFDAKGRATSASSVAITGAAPTGSAGGDLTGTYPNPTVAALAITDAKVAAANKDGASGTASMRTLGTGAAQAAAGNDSRLSDARTPTAHATSHHTGGSDALAAADIGAAATSHTHAAADVVSGVLDIGRLATGTPDGTKFVRDDGTLAVPAGTGFANPMTTAGDVILGGSSGTPGRLAKGSDSQVLTVDPTTHLPAWATPSAGFTNPMTTQDDIIVGGASGTAGRLAKGSDSQVLTVDPITHHLAWATPTAGITGEAIQAAGSAIATRATLNVVSRIAIPVDDSGNSRVNLRVLDPATMAFIKDEFFCSTVNSNSIGELNWATTSGSSVAQTLILGHPGVIQRTTNTSSGTSALFGLGVNTAGQLHPSDLFDMLWIVRLNTNDANTTVRVGLGDSTFAMPSSSGIYFEKLDADTGWFGVTYNGGSSTRTGSQVVAVSTGWIKMRIRRIDASNIGFSVDSNATFPIGASGTQSGETAISTNIPTGAIFPSQLIKNSAAAAKTIDIDYFDMAVTGLSR